MRDEDFASGLLFELNAVEISLGGAEAGLGAPTSIRVFIPEARRRTVVLF